METWQVLKETPIFSHLTEEEAKKLAKKFREETAFAGDLIFSEGAIGDSFYIIKSGAVDVIAQGKFLATLKRGNCFGEMALLSAQVRLATVRAAVDSEFLTLSKKEFDELISEDPALESSLTHILKDRLHRTYVKKHHKTKRPSIVVAIEREEDLAKPLPENLYSVIRGKAICVQPKDVKTEGIETICENINRLSAINVSGLLVPFTERFDCIIVRSADDKKMNPGFVRAAELADLIFSYKPIHGLKESVIVGEINWERIVRLARIAGGCGIGLALAGDLAWGLGVLGVLSLWEEENLPVDAISATGSSSIVASLYAKGCGVSEIEDALYSLDRKTFFNQNRLSEWLKTHIPDSFSNLPIPLFIVTTDLLRGEKVVMEEGGLSSAVIASLSIPGIFKPTIIDKKVLADGRMSDLSGEETLLEKRVSFSVQIEATGFCKIKSRSFTMRDGILLARQVMLAKSPLSFARRVGICYDPSERDILWSDFDRLKEIKEMAYNAAQSMLSEIKSIVEQ